MEPSTDSHDNAWPLTEELFAIPFAADILLFLRGKQGCSEDEMKDEVCNCGSLEKALKFLSGKGLVEVGDVGIRLTSKGKDVAEILDSLEKLFPNQPAEACTRS